MFGNLMSIPQVSGVYPDLGVNQESLKGLGIPYGVRMPRGPRKTWRPCDGGGGERGEAAITA